MTKTTKIIATTLIIASTIATSFGASGSTSTGSTSTGTTSTGVITPTPVVSIKGAGGAWVGFNYTKNSLDFVPQCFPWVFVTEYLKGNIFDMYKNQNKCRVQRAIDFKL